jgi:hypothetical protein
MAPDIAASRFANFLRPLIQTFFLFFNRSFCLFL